MPRFRNRKTPRTRRLVALTALLALLGWGLWQWRVVYASILRDVPPETAQVNASVVSTNAATAAASVPLAQPNASENDDPAAPDAVADANDSGAPANILVDQPEDLSTEALANRGREIDLLLASADEAAEAGDILTQRQKLNAALALIGESARGADVREELTAINTGIFLGSDVLVQDSYAPLISIEPGDSFTRLGHHYHLTPELLAALNPQLPERDLRPGNGIKIVYGPFHVRVIKHDLRLDLYARDMYVRSYKIQLDDGNFLPAGTYRVKSQGRIRLPGADGLPPRDWIAFEPSANNPGIDEAWFYGSSGPRKGAGPNGVRLDDSDLYTVYNALVERDSLVRVDP